MHQCDQVKLNKSFEDQLVIDWRMPMDLTRVMLFENLQYLIKDAEFEGLFKNVNDEEIRTQSQLIITIKQLYAVKLPLYKS